MFKTLSKSTKTAFVYGVASAAMIGIGLYLEPAFADTAGEIGAHVAGQGEDIGKSVSVIFYVLGMALGGAAFMKLKSNRDNPQQHPLSHAAVLFVAAAGLLFLPETFQSSGDTLYDKGAIKNDVAGTTAIGG